MHYTMMVGRLRVLLLTGRGCHSRFGLSIALPSPMPISHLVKKRNLRTHRLMTSVTLPFIWDEKSRLLSPCRIGLSNSARSVTDSNDSSTKNSQVESIMYELKMKLERLGRLKLNDMNQVVKSLEHSSEELLDVDCQRLLQFCSRMVEEEYRPCDDLIQRVWYLTIHRQNGRVTLEHLESYLHLCLLVKSVNMSERNIFEQLDKHRIEPNKRVLEMLMMALGLRGRLEGIKQVLTMMKESSMSVREATFAAFILAYGTNNDMDGIQGVLDTMRSTQMSMSEVTFGALIVTWGLMGNVWRIRQVLVQARKEGVSLSTSQLEAALLALIKNGHAGDKYENVESVLRLIDGREMKLDVSRMALHLIYSGLVMEAVHLLLFLPLLRTNNHLYSNGAIYLREIVQAGTDPDLVVKACQRLQKEGINNFALQVALEEALKEQWEELSWLLLRTIKEAGMPLREHYFWPLLHLKAIAQEPTQLLECVKTMLQLGESPGYATLRDHVIPGLSLSQPRLALQMLQNAGLSATAITTPLLVVLVKNNMMEHAIKFVKETKTPFHVGDAIDTLASSWHTKPKSIMSLLALLVHRKNQEQPSSKNTDDWGGQFLLHLATTRTGLAVHHIQPLFQELRKHRISVSEHSTDLLMSRLSQPLQDAVKTNLHLILQADTEHPSEEKNTSLPHPEDMSEEELEGHLEELKAKGFNTRGSLRRLLLLRASRNNTAGVLELMQSASKNGMQLSAGMLSGVLEAYVKNGNTEAALELFSYITTEHPSFHLDQYKVVDLCTLLTQSGKASEAEEILQNCIMKSNRKIDSKNIRRNCRNLLLATATTSSPEKTEKIYELLLRGEFVKPETVTLGVLIKSRLIRDDSRGAVNTFKRIHRQYGCLPMRRELLIHLIHYQHVRSKVECGDSQKLLEDTLNFITKVKGSQSAQHELLFAYIEAGHPSEAATILQKLGRNLDQSQLTRQLEYYVKNENETAMVDLLTASRGIDTINHQAIYSSLLKIYYVQSAGEKGLSLWTSMQEENRTPTPSFLSTLAALLAACKMKIPFSI